MNLKTVAAKIGRGDVQYLLGRFKTVRVSYSNLQRLRGVVRRAPRATAAARPSMFEGVDVDRAVRTIREDAVFVGLQLPAAIVNEIAAFASAQPLHARNAPDGVTFRYDEVHRGHTADGRGVPLGGVHEPSRCAAVQAIVDDPLLRRMVREYLHYEPSQISTLLTWSFASDFTDDERRRLKHHVIDYHYDVGGYNFVYVSFYLLDTDRYSGAHVMMKRSHDRKPLRMLLGSAVASEAAVYQQFGLENEITIEGPAGTGFIQDTSCYHRATPPTQRDRLMLQVRFS